MMPTNTQRLDYRAFLRRKGHDCLLVEFLPSVTPYVGDVVKVSNYSPCLVKLSATTQQQYEIKGREKAMLQRMIKYCKRYGISPVLAVRYPNRGWIEYSLATGDLPVKLP